MSTHGGGKQLLGAQFALVIALTLD